MNLVRTSALASLDPSMRSKDLIVLCLICLLTAPARPCKKARAEEVPHGANEIVVFTEQTVPRLEGIVVLPNAEPVRDAVVEVYRYDGTADGTKTFLSHAKRIAACLTSENGRFAFKRLRPGRYLLRAGTVESAGINELQAIFRVTGRGTTHKIEMRLSMGT